MATKEKSKIKHYKFLGNYESHSIVIGHSADTVIRVEGNFNISGILHCPRKVVSFTVDGKGKVKFRGICKMLFIRYATGKSVLDFRDVRCEEVVIEKLGGEVEVLIGEAQWINKANMEGHSILKIVGQPTILNFTLNEFAKIIHSKHHIESDTIL